MPGYKFISKESVRGKTLIVRVGLDSNVENKELFPGARIRVHANSLKELSEKGAKVVALAHQGRHGEEDCISLKQHAEEISEQIGKEVKLLKWDSGYLAPVKEMQNGEIILMENVRFHEGEEKEYTAEEASKVEWVQQLASVADMFVQNALSVCHRSQPSVIGFAPLLPSFVGPFLEKELNALHQYEKGERPAVFILGGAKIDDSIELMKTVLENGRADTICVGGLLGELFLKASGKKLGEKDKFFEEQGFDNLIEPAKQLLSAYGEKMVFPADLAVLDEDDERQEIGLEDLPSDFLICDIGMETVAAFRKFIQGAKLVVFNGPLGMFEKHGCDFATKKVLNEMAKSKAFSIVGGGETVDALEEMDFTFEQFSHVSLGGKALLQYLSGKPLSGLLALQK